MRVALFGATGTIGRATAIALRDAGHEVICPLRARTGADAQRVMEQWQRQLPGVTLHVGEAGASSGASSAAFTSTLSGQQRALFERERIDAVVSCLASRTGAPADAWDVDYRLQLDLLASAQQAGVPQFVLLSAICVQKPLLAFQHAKLAFEQALQQSGLRYSIVRPTAFFKSLSGQVRRVQQGKPYLLFGDGRLTACKPISDADLGRYLALCLSDADKQNRILPIGGPGAAITPIEQGAYLFERLRMKPRYRHVPVAMLDVIIQALRIGGVLLPSWAAKAELARIGRYYATESMLVWDAANGRYDADATPSFGTHSLFDHYDQLIAGDATVDLGEHAVF